MHADLKVMHLVINYDSHIEVFVLSELKKKIYIIWFEIKLK